MWRALVREATQLAVIAFAAIAVVAVGFVTSSLLNPLEPETASSGQLGPAEPGASVSRVEATVPPVAVSQTMPEWPVALTPAMRKAQTPLAGALDVVVDTNGNVTSVKVVRSIHPAYDALLVKVARDWKYRPAIRGGKPVEYVHRVVVNVTLK